MKWNQLPSLRGQRATVMGLGRFGGSLGAIRWLAEQGAEVLVTDPAKPERLTDSIAAMSPLIDRGQVRVRLGEHLDDDFSSAAIVVASAAVPMPWQNPLLTLARRSGAVVTTEIALALRALDGSRTIAVTGSAGKSTTTTLLHLAACASGRKAVIGGNLGGSLLNHFAEASAADWLVLELSSAQLWWLSAKALTWGGMASSRWSPDIGILTNIAANHVDWHGELRHYIESKSGICPQDPKQFCSLADPVTTGALAASCGARVWWPQRMSALVEAPALLLPGAHNKTNAALALTAAGMMAAMDGCPFNMSAARSALASFKGLSHRLEFVGECSGIRCYNDSKSTTPQSTRLAVASFADPSRIHLIAGGYDKGADLSGIRALAPSLGGLYAIGTTGPALVGERGGVFVETLDRAVSAAMKRARTGDILLLSPGCASWDQFADFESRGVAFCALCTSHNARTTTQGSVS
ncbi:MAG: UDP-N-acetylmuramoyl-L-alanine--D-glutamate ligase [Planctomycetota bacterium]|nr:UDP-N-acetylmuramoyl-L-alanine--D-glutamate ligase [Planctomycetota bacterium]